MNPSDHPLPINRRRFLQTGAAISALPILGSITPAFAAGSDRLRVGVIGCGGRGIGAVRNIVEADKSVQIVAMGELFQDRLDTAYKQLKEGNPKGNQPVPPIPADQFLVTPDTCFTGFEAYKKVLASDLDIVMLTTTPHFRPMHIRAAVEAGVHIFAEKPVAVDPVGCRHVMESAEMAAKKGLALVAGTQRRHQPNYLESMKRVQDGAIGELTGGQGYWNQGLLWHRGREPQWSEMEYQLRNWYYFTWLCGDHIVEQHFHQLDVLYWAFGGAPAKVYGMGGRQSRTEEKYGDIYDHFAVEYEYANGVRLASYCRQADGTSGRVNERLVGAKGFCDPSGTITGPNAWKYDGPGINGQVQEHVDMIKSIRDGKPLNHGKRLAEVNLMAVLGRMSAYTGREISFEWGLKASKLDLTPKAYAWGPAPEVKVAIPGVTPLV